MLIKNLSSAVKKHMIGNYVGDSIVNWIRIRGIDEDMYYVTNVLQYKNDAKNPSHKMNETRHYFKNNKERVRKNTDLLEDQESKECYRRAIAYRYTNDMRKRPCVTKPRYFPDDIFSISNDEVFTPPEIANALLDTLPQDIFSDPTISFLDPACKSGVILREAAKRFIKGLEKEIPNLQERINHIYQNQLFGIGITELTSLLSRRR